jgi:2-polyprenyl-3-methyl-5-hydroxy-6-metoxy-1,4-benzoquinol methylase
MNLNAIGIVKKDNTDREENVERQDRKSGTVLTLNNIEVFNAVDFFVDKFLTQTPKDVKVLDVGARIGSGIKRFNQRGFKRVQGVDISKKSVKNSMKYGFKIRCCDIETDEENLMEFKVIFCRHVLEHTINLKDALNDIYKKLGLNGKFLLIVPLNEAKDEIIESHNYNFIKSDSLLKLVLETIPVEILYYSIENRQQTEMWLIGKKLTKF